MDIYFYLGMLGITVAWFTLNRWIKEDRRWQGFAIYLATVIFNLWLGYHLAK